MKQKLSELFATVFKIGTVPFAPGTVGSLVAFGAWYWIFPRINLLLFVIITLIIMILGVITSSIIEEYTKESDPSRIIIDEWVGQWIAFWFVPYSIGYGLSAFLLFRLFDIWKPGLIRKLDKLHNGWGVMLDDVAAGFLSGIILLMYRLFIQ